MKTLPVILVLILFGGLSLAAQTTGNNCPEVKIAGPEYLTKPGESAIFTASIGSSDQSHKFEYIWTVSLGVIIKGQGTPSISVSTTTKDENSNMTATLKVAGLPQGCQDTAAATNTISTGIYDLEKVDEFGRLSRGDVRARMYNFFIRLNYNLDLEGIISVYLNKADSRSSRIAYLNTLYDAILRGKHDPARLTFVMSESDDVTLTKFWMIPDGDDAGLFGTGNPVVIKGEELKRRMKTLFLKK